MADQVSFRLDLAQCGDLTGVSLFVDDGGDELTCYRMLFRGPKLEQRAFIRLFERAHQSGMNAVGLSGEIEWQVYEAMLEDSLEIAGTLMGEQGYLLISFDDIEPELKLVLLALFTDPEDTSQLN